jgi:hypothetical protein
MEQNGILPCSQEPAIEHYRKADKSNLYFLYNMSLNIILLCLLRGLFLHVFQTNLYEHFSFFSCALHAPPIYIRIIGPQLITLKCYSTPAIQFMQGKVENIIVSINLKFSGI